MEPIRVRFGINESITHSLYREFLDFPPDSVIYITDTQDASAYTISTRAPRIVTSLRRNEFIRGISDRLFVRALPDEKGKSSRLCHSIGRLAMRLTRTKKSRTADLCKFDLFHSAGSAMIEIIPWIIDNDVRWVVDFEHAPSLFGYYGNWRKRIYRSSAQRVITKQLCSDYCRKLMPWTNAARTTVLNLLHDKRIEEKMEVLRLAIRPAPARPRDIESHDSVRILFIGSVNFKGEFWSKGGYEVLEAYRRLREIFGQAVELNFRCWMPDDLKKKYAAIEGLNILTEVLPREKLDRLFWESDIFLFPAHNTPGMAFLEAMRFGLPIVAKDIWANREFVRHEVNGLLVEPSKNIPYYLPGFIPNWSGDDGPFIQYMKQRDERVIADLVNSLQRLVESKNLRTSLGNTGRKLVEEGEFSIRMRNQHLRRIYEEAARR
jgi:glycosyltransferase involved in cell wall biosynthesis